MLGPLPGWTAPQRDAEEHLRAYSTVGDVLAYLRCRRQYGLLHVRGYENAAATQQYFGTLVHDVLDQVNRGYRMGQPLPDEAGVRQLVDEAHDRLVRSGVRAHNPAQQRARATRFIYRFIALTDRDFFDHVQQTEYPLQRALRTPAQGIDYILEGVVDVLSGAVSHALRLPYSTEPEDVEIWDYKSGRRPDAADPFMQAYTYQMRVYLELYRQQTGVYPARAVLVFLGELDDDTRWQAAGGRASYFPDLFVSVEPNPTRIAEALDRFHETVEAIEHERGLPYDQQWQAPADPPDEQTCRACPWSPNCDAYPQGRTERHRPL